MDPRLDDSDWEEAFSFATPEWAPPRKEHGKSFAREDVAEIMGLEVGENDGSDWVVYGRLVDGRYFFLTAGCDFTGWECRASGRAYCADTLADLLQYGMDFDERKRLGTAYDAATGGE